jgi:hypothetical protein
LIVAFFLFPVCAAAEIGYDGDNAYYGGYHDQQNACCGHRCPLAAEETDMMVIHVHYGISDKQYQRKNGYNGNIKVFLFNRLAEKYVVAFQIFVL